MTPSRDNSRIAESFRGLVLRHRGRTGLTQSELAMRMGTGRRTVQDWEAGVNYPSAERLRMLIQALLETGGLTVGREVAEVHELWAAVLKESPRMHTPFDDMWFAALLAARAAPISGPLADAVAPASGISIPDVPGLERRQDWGEAPDVIGFVGRGEEMELLRKWVLEEHCRLVAVLGMGGIGKTTLVARLAQDIAPEFQGMYWRSLRDALPFSEWLRGAVGFLSGRELAPTEGEAARLTVLLDLLRERPSLLVLDNFDTLLEPGQREGTYREGYAGYSRLLEAIGGGRHESCLVVTSREAPPDLMVLGGGAVRTLELGGLGFSAGQALLADKQLSGNADDWAKLVGRFGGNGLALKVVGESIRELFDGDINAFLEASGSRGVFGGIRRLLAEQIGRSSPLEQDALRVLAVAREPVSIAELIADLAARVGRGAVLEAVEALRRRSLVERAATGGAVAFRLQSVVLEYVTDRLVEAVSDEIAGGHPTLLLEQPFIKAQAKDYVRHTQERVIGEPILQRLQAESGDGGADQRLLALLQGWRGRPEADQGYGPGNVVNLLRLRRGELRNLDLSHLVLRQAYLAGVEAQDTRLAGANLEEAVLAEAFNFPISLALSGDGTLLVAGTSAGEVWLWRVADHTPLLALQGHTGVVWGVALSADRQLLASGSEDGTVRLWDVPSGRPVAQLKGHVGGIRGVALSADGRLIVSGGLDGTIRLWDVPSGQPLFTRRGHTGAVSGVALSADARLIASCGEDGAVRLWEGPNGQPLATLQGHVGGVWGVALSADGQLLASGGLDGVIRLWRPPSGRPIAVLVGHTGAIAGVAMSEDGRLLASGSEDGTVRFWEVSEGRELATLQGHTGGVWGVALSADGRLLTSGGLDGIIRLWDAPARQLVTSLQGHTSGIWGVAMSADGRLLASGGLNEIISLWDTSSGQLLTSMQGHTGPVYGVAVSADGRLLVSGGFDSITRFWEVPSGRMLAAMPGHTGGVRGVALSSDGRLAASGSFDGTIRLWAAPSGQPLATLEGHSGPVWGVALNADGRLLASGGLDGTVRLWDANSGRVMASLQGHTSGVWGVALSADGKLLASGSWDGTVRLWQVSSGQLLATLQGHTGGIRAVAFSADGRLLASGGLDGTVRLWDANNGRPLATLHEHTSGVWGVALSADGRLLASGSWDGTVRLWEASNGTHLRALRSDRRYERVEITGLRGITAAQRAALLALGAIEH